MGRRVEMGWEEERRELGRGGLTEETFCSLPENLSLDPRWAGAWGCGGAPLSGGRGGPGGAGQACFQGIQAQILTWPTQSPLPQHEPQHEPHHEPHHDPILRKGSERLGNLFRVTGEPSSRHAVFWGAVRSMWFPFPFLIHKTGGKRYFRFSFGSEVLILLFFAAVLLPQWLLPLDRVRAARPHGGTAVTFAFTSAPPFLEAGAIAVPSWSGLFFS